MKKEIEKSNEWGSKDRVLCWREIAINLYKSRKITLREASELAGVSLREMLDLLMEHGIAGNVTLKQQQKSLKYVEGLLKS